MSSDDKRPLGRIRLQRKLVPRELQEAMQEEPPSSSVPVAPAAPEPPSGEREVPAAAVERDPEAEALLALADRTGSPGLDLRQLTILLEHLDVVPREVAEALCILPVLQREDRIYLAMGDPHDKRAIDELEFVTAKRVQAFIAVRTTLVRTIAAAYDAKARGDRHYRGPRAPVE